MPKGLKTKGELAKDAHVFAGSCNLVRYREVTYLPVHYETGEHDPAPDPEDTMWLPLSRQDIQEMAGAQYDTLFANDSELRSFEYMTAQNAQPMKTTAHTLLVRTTTGLKELDEAGQLVEPTGKFLPNTLVPLYNDDKALKAEVFEVISGWLDSDEEAHSLLHHMATCLAPGYSAIKYVLLLGDGRNGKSVLLKMLQSLFGLHNVASVTRQDMAAQSPVVCELNGKLLNLVFDGKSEYLKDSGTEKTLIAGETVTIRKLYESTPTMVRTNALFVEGLNKEPKSSDKSSALLKRLVRFQFPNVYAQDHKFERHMLGADMLGAFLALLIEHYVTEEEVAEKLRLTAKAMELQLEHMYVNSLGLQFLKHVEEHDPLGTLGLLTQPMGDLVKMFQSWRVKENDLGSWSEPDVLALMAPLINSERKSMRVNGSPRKVRVAVSYKEEAKAFLESLEGVPDGTALVVDEAALVAN